MNVGELFARLRLRDHLTNALGRALNFFKSKAKEFASHAGSIASGSAQMGTRLAALSVAGASAAAGLASAAQGGVALVAALAPAIGIVAALPGAIALSRAAMITLQIALSGVQEAFKAALADDPAKFAKSLEGLSPAARAAAMELRLAKPAIDALRSSVQDAFFAPLAGHITAVAAALSGPLTSGMSGAASQMGLAAAEAARFAASAQTSAAVTSIFGALRSAVAAIQPAIAPLLAGFRDLAVVGAGFSAGLVPGIAAAAARFGQFLSNAAASGQALAWMQGAVAVFRQLASIAGDVIGIVRGVFSAMQTGGTGALGVVGQLLAQVNAFVNSAQGQQILVTIFQSLSQVGGALFPIFQALAGSLALVAPHVAAIAVALGPGLAAAVSALGPALAALGPGLTLVAQMLSQAFANPALQAGLLALGQGLSAALAAVAPLLPVIGQLAGIIGQVLGMALQNLSAVLGPVISALASSLQPILPILSQATTELAAATAPLAAAYGQLLAQALKMILPPLLQLAQSLLPPILDLVKALIPLVTSWVGELTKILGAVQPIIPPLVQIGTALLPVWIKIITAVVKLLQGDFRGALQSIMSAIKGFGDTIMNAGKALMEGLWNGIVAAGNQIKSRIVGFLRSILPQPVLDFLGIASPSKLFAWMGRQVPAGLALGITRGGGLVRAAVQRMAGIVAGAGIPDVPMPGLAVPGGGAAGGLGGTARTVIHQTNYYPQAEPTSTSVNRGLQLAGALGVI
ncbi:phage tail protein [[Actinomadura] parvosata]|uniref:phage tail protein n=1 Tax=[Actinomadura] parvosata TaxID=1955412 RepID=UPI00406BE34B